MYNPPFCRRPTQGNSRDLKHGRTEKSIQKDHRWKQPEKGVQEGSQPEKGV
jgi:hypothetical protein